VGHQGFAFAGLYFGVWPYVAAIHAADQACTSKWRIQHPLAGFAHPPQRLPAATHQGSWRCLAGIPPSRSISLKLAVLPRQLVVAVGAISLPPAG